MGSANEAITNFELENLFELLDQYEDRNFIPQNPVKESQQLGRMVDSLLTELTKEELKRVTQVQLLLESHAEKIRELRAMDRKEYKAALAGQIVRPEALRFTEEVRTRISPDGIRLNS